VIGDHAPCWNPSAERMPREQIGSLQLERLRVQVERAVRIPGYARRLREVGVTAQDLRSIADLGLFPVLSKEDLRGAYPFGFCAVAGESIVRIHATSGTTGKLTVSPYTRSDMELWGELMARTLTAAGVTSADILHNAFGYGLFTGGLGFDLGAQVVGCASVPVSSGLTSRQIMLIEDFSATVLACTPSYALVIAEEAGAAGIDVRRRWKLKTGIFGAEPWTEGVRREIQQDLALEAFDVYGLAEMIGPGVAVECLHHDGLHVFEDHFLAEVLDPDTLQPVPEGTAGELVLTSLSREALPLIRYRTHDRTRVQKGPCPCGRTSARISRLEGRTDDMLIIRGVNVFPSQIESVLLEVSGLAPQYLILVDRPRHHLDHLEVWVEATAETFALGEILRRRVQEEAHHRLRDLLGISVHVSIVEPHRIERSLGKAVRVVDRRHAG